MKRNIYSPNPLNWCEPNTFEVWYYGLASPYRDNGKELLDAVKGSVVMIDPNGTDKWLEVSTRSESNLGKRLSAFNLKVKLAGTESTVESIYQASKVFERGGPFLEVAEMRPWIAKKYIQTKKNGLGEIKGFSFHKDYPSQPPELFYTFLYFSGLRTSLTEEDKTQLVKIQYFTDIMANPLSSINTQARAMARYVSMMRLGIEMPNDQDELLDFIKSEMKKKD